MVLFVIVAVLVVLVGVLTHWRWGLRSGLDRASRAEAPARSDVAERARVAQEIGRQIDTGRDAGYRATSNLPPSL
ncbi:hypothetical protein GTR02_20255 [Kineococcus sp. R8]|uniref:hypothetical protein n=1 Tax=Kineococcus siccus TaxID=2696567 RepID=UPI00141372ED|nr:hypothetical protein [Kineococcus siccus]NAZ84143.1 hypothetical protein [Kineococcus siccus]